MPLVNSDVAWAVDEVKSRVDPLAKFRDYDEGRHRLAFATAKYREAFADVFREFADNMCDDVLNSISDRLQMTGWTVPGADEATPGEPAAPKRTQTPLEVALEASWTANQGESRTGALWRRAFRDGDGFRMVQKPRSGGPARVYLQDSATMCIRYSTDAPDEVEVVGKLWREGQRYRLNIYRQEKLERYATRGLGAAGGIPNAPSFQKLSSSDNALVAVGADSWEMPYEDGEGLPVYHYPNGELSAYGRSLLDGVIPLQDAYNKALLDMLVAMEYNAYPQRWATGLELPTDPITGETVNPFTKGEGRLWRNPSKDGEFGQFTPGDVEGFLAVQDRLQLSILRKGVMPAHGITLRSQTGQAPTGVSLLVAEGRTIKMALDRQRDWGQEAAREQAHLLRLDGVTDAQSNDVEPVWVPPQTRDMVALLEEARLKRELKVPLEVLWAEMGYEAEQVREFAQVLEAALEAEDQAVAALSGGRGGRMGRGRVETLNGALGLPGGPQPPAGGSTALAQE